MNKFEILAQAKTRRAKAETQVRILSNLAIPIKKDTHEGVFLFYTEISQDENSRSEFE